MKILANSSIINSLAAKVLLCHSSATNKMFGYEIEKEKAITYFMVM